MPSQEHKPVLIDTVSDDIRVINKSANIKQRNAVSAYALSNIFKGTPFDRAKYDDANFYTDDKVDLDKITIGCLRRINDHVLNGPPISDTNGYLHVVTCSGDVTWNNSNIITETPEAIRIRQIVYPDNTNDPTPYTRVGYSATLAGTITWSPWNTLGGNMIRRLLLTNVNPALPNSMYESFGNYTLTLPDPNSYSLGTRIGLEQYVGVGQVVYSDKSQNTAPDTDQNGTVIGAMIYLFEVVDATPDNATNTIKEYAWRMDTLQNYDNSISELEEQIAEHRLTDQTNVAAYILDTVNNISGTFIVPQNGYMEYTFTPGSPAIVSAWHDIKRNGTSIASILHTNTTVITTGGAYVKGLPSNGTIKASTPVITGDVVTFVCAQMTKAIAAGASSPIRITFSPDEHQMYLRDDELNDSWHDLSTLSSHGGFFTTSKHLKIAENTPASVKGLISLEAYVDERDVYVTSLLETHKTSDDHDNRYIRLTNITDTYHTTSAVSSKVISQLGISNMATTLQSKGLLYGPVKISSATLNSITEYGIYEITSIASGGPVDTGIDIESSNYTLIVIPYSDNTAATVTANKTVNTTTILQILVCKSAQQNITFRTRVANVWQPWARVAKAKKVITISAGSTVSAAQVSSYLYWCEPTFVMYGGNIVLPNPASFPSGTKIQVESTSSNEVTITWSSYTYSVGLTNGNRTLIPLESDGSNWYMVCVG